jgi:uncharacterized protein YhaN
MRLLSLQLTRYGHFAGERIGFDPRPGRINLLCAPNGAGKSVLRQAFCDLLFGIHAQSTMNFRFGYSGMRLTAEAVHPDGSRFTFGRRKGVGNTLIDAAGNAAEPGLLTPLLGPADRALLERLFALDTEQLRQGGKALLESGGSVADAVLSGGGVRGARALRQSLEAGADALAPAKRSAQRPFYRALDTLKDARTRASAALLRPDDWARMERELAEADFKKSAQNQIAADLARQMARLQRTRRVRAPMAARDAALAWLTAHPDAPMLAPSLEARLADAAKKVAIAAEQMQTGLARRSDLALELGAIEVDNALLDSAEAIERLGEQAGAVAKALIDIPQRQAEHKAVVTRISALLRKLDSNVAPAQADRLIPPRAAESRTRALIAQHGAVAAAVEQAPVAIAAAARDIAEAEAALDALPATPASDLVRALVAEIRAGGDPSLRAEDAAHAQAESDAALMAARAAVPGWGGDAAALLALTLPPAASFERLEAVRRGAAHEVALQQDRAQKAAERQKQAERRLSLITAGGIVADETAVTAARQHRERGWQLVYRLAFTPTPPSAEEQAAFAREQPLPLAYQSAVQHADGLADQRVLQADRIAQAAAARLALSDAEAEAKTAYAAWNDARARDVTAQHAWSEGCSALPLGAAPDLAEVRSFLAARDRVIERHAAAVRDRDAAARLNERHGAWRERLQKALAGNALGGPDSPTLAALLAEAEARMAAAVQITQQRVALEARLRELRRRQQSAAAAAVEAERRLAVWQDAWGTALAALGRPAGEHPGVTSDVLAVLSELDQELKTAGQLDERLSQMRDDNAAFTVLVGALLDHAAPDLNENTDTLHRLAALRTLRERLQGNRDRATRRAELQKILDQTDRQVTQIRQRLVHATAERDAVLGAIGADTVEAAEQRLAASRDRSQHILAREQAEARLLTEGDGLSIEALREELAALHADDVAAALEAAQTTMNAAQEAAQEAAAEASRQKLQMEQRAGDGGYERAIADQQSALATIDRVLDEAVVTRLAALLLERAMGAVESQTGSALLSRIGGYFRTLTNGAYQSIMNEDAEDGRLALVMVPADMPNERKRVEALSEGTRDQLFLALRLAAIEDHVASAPPLPFIGDDILQTSDDVRATAALQALLELSQHVQVILLTHHQHIVSLADALPKGCVHVCDIAREAA